MNLLFAGNRTKLWVLLSRVVVLKVDVESFEFVWQAMRGAVPKGGFDTYCSLMFEEFRFVLQ